MKNNIIHCKDCVHCFECRKSIMEFKKVKQLLAENFDSISARNSLFEVDIDKDYLWNLYLDSFPEGTNPIYHERRQHDCSACRQFIKNVGGTVYIDGNLTTHSIFEFDTHSETFQPVMDAMATYVKSRPIIDIYLNDSPNVGIDKNRELLDKIEIIKYIFHAKEMEAEARTVAAKNAAKKQHILDILARKQEDALQNMSEDELMAMLNELG